MQKPEKKKSLNQTKRQQPAEKEPPEHHKDQKGEMDEDDFGGIPERDMKKNLGCG